MTALLILAACLLAAGCGVLLGSLAPHAFGYALGLLALVSLGFVLVSAWRRYGAREAANWALFIAVGVGAILFLGLDGVR
jgi:hypothetical protein